MRYFVTTKGPKSAFAGKGSLSAEDAWDLVQRANEYGLRADVVDEVGRVIAHQELKRAAQSKRA